MEINDEQIKYMVDRFLEWRLPENFHPDAGISFKPNFNENTAYPMKHEPIGTNLFDATQAEEMVRYLIDGMPTDERRKVMRELAQQACNEIRQLRTRVEILEAQLAIVDVFAAALGLKRRDSPMTVDVVWQIERELEKQPEEIKPV